MNILHLLILSLHFSSPMVYASSHRQESSHLNVYHSIVELLGIPLWAEPLLGALLVSLFILLAGLVFNSKVSKKIDQKDILPEKKFSFLAFIESVLDIALGVCRDQFGPKYLSFFSILAGTFVYVLANNLSGLVPGFPPSTENFSMNLSLGLFVFVIYNFWGIKENGLGYLKQFTGPFVVLAPLLLCLELISHLARPLSLSFRLAANILGDHLVLEVFGQSAPLVVPALLSFFGLLVACIQSFVFMLLPAVYISMAISHDH